MAEIIVLGSSAATPFPRTLSDKLSDYADISRYAKKFPLHDDPICNWAKKKNGKNNRTRAAIAIRTSKGTVLFNAGPDIYFQMEKYDIVEPKAVFINHEHYDASANAAKLRKEGVKIYSVRNGNISPEIMTSECGIEVTSFPVQHAAKIKTLGFLARCGKTTLLIAMDFSSLSGLKPYFTQADILFVDGSILSEDLPTHLSIDHQLAYYRTHLTPEDMQPFPRVIFTHIGHHTLTHRQLKTYVKHKYPGAEVAYDGMRIELP